MISPHQRILGLFPSVGGIDGIGRSGLAAWTGICSADTRSATLLSYGPTAPPPGLPGRICHARTISTTVLRALALRPRADLTLVWHLHLLKLLSFLKGTGKIVVFLHGIEAWTPLPPAIIRNFHKVSLVLTNSDFTWHRFLHFNPAFRHLPQRTVPLGLGEPASQALPPPDCPPAALMIGRASRTESYKGHHEVIAAWPDVLGCLPDAQLHMLGAGDLRDDLRATAVRHGVADATHIHGPVSEERKESLILQSRCMALPSRGEGFGLAYIESMRLARPCLVSNQDAGREVVNPPEAGLSADPANLPELTAALIRLLSPTVEWKDWSTRARLRYENCYTEAHFSCHLRAALQEVL